MKAPMSDQIRRILSNPKTANDFFRQVIASRRGSDTIELNIDGEQVRFGRVAVRQITNKPDTE